MNRLRKVVSSLGILIFLSSWTLAPDKDCQVLLSKISGKYEGDCKKGKAHGIGKAMGEDTYEGEFKKGLPHGEGKYTWSNGDYFEGIWKNGSKEGEGKLVFVRENKPDSVVTGFWKEDEYFGKYENPYKVESKSPNINKIQVVKKGITPNQFEVVVMRKNAHVGISNLKINSNAGTFYDKKNVVGQFPVELDIEFDSKSPGGLGTGKEKFNCKVKLFEEGNWQITIDLTNV